MGTRNLAVSQSQLAMSLICHKIGKMQIWKWKKVKKSRFFLKNPPKYWILSAKQPGAGTNNYIADKQPPGKHQAEISVKYHKNQRRQHKQPEVYLKNRYKEWIIKRFAAAPKRQIASWQQIKRYCCCSKAQTLIMGFLQRFFGVRVWVFQNAICPNMRCALTEPFWCSAMCIERLSPTTKNSLVPTLTGAISQSDGYFT